MSLIDTHCHIHEADYPLAVKDVLSQARQAGVEQMICVGTDIGSSKRAVEFAAKHKGVYASIGIHPHNTEGESQEFAHQLDSIYHHNGFAPGLTGAPAPGQTRAADVFGGKRDQSDRAVIKRVTRGGVAPPEPNEVSEGGADRAAGPAISDLRSEAYDGSGALMCAVDKDKDQTYFLYRVTGEALAKTLFPIGEFKKSEVRKMAERRRLYTAAKKDSQGICFVGQVGIRDFLNQYVDTKPGNIIDKKTGQKLGIHDGAIFYTLGQRHGLDVGGGLPYYVAGKDMKKNIVYVTTDLNDNSLWKQEVELVDVHWINPIYHLTPTTYQIKIRSRHRAKLVKAKLSITKSGAKLHLKDPERAIAAGQSVVIYDGDVCLGGGIAV